MKKKFFFKMSLIVVFALFVGYNIYASQIDETSFELLLADVEAMADPSEGAGTCKWKVIDCPGWGNGDYEACLTNGDGNVCTCGSVTRECKK